jgi:hypothetical protein
VGDRTFVRPKMEDQKYPRGKVASRASDCCV